MNRQVELMPGVEMLRGAGEHARTIAELDDAAESRWREEVRREAEGKGLAARTVKLYGYKKINPKTTKRAREAQRILVRLAREDAEERMAKHGPNCIFCHKPTAGNCKNGYHTACFKENGYKLPNGTDPRAKAEPRRTAPVEDIRVVEQPDPEDEIKRAQRERVRQAQLEAEATAESFDAMATALGLDPEEMVTEYKRGWIDRIKRAAVAAGIPGILTPGERLRELQRENPIPAEVNEASAAAAS